MKKYIILFAGLFFLMSCEDFLDEEPKSEMSVGQYFSEPSHAYNAVNSLYRDGFPGFFGAGSAYRGNTAMIGGYLSGLFDNEYKGQEVHVEECHNLTLDPVNMSGYLDGIWDPCYTAISRANNAIKYVPTTVGLSSDEALRLEAEARFFRALNYFHLVKTFGDVPLILEAYESLDKLYVERTPSAEIYEQIIKDLTFALEEGGLDDNPMPMNDFRISKGSVSAVLADVYLTASGYPVREDHYDEAADAARAIISSPNYSLIEHGEDLSNSAYNKLRTSDMESEYLYVIEFEAGIAESGWLPTYSYPNRAATWGIFQYSITNNAYRPVEELLRIYDPEDDLRIQEKQFFHSSVTYMEGDEEVTKTFETSPYLWHDDKALFETGRGGKDVAVYRYAELLLIAAEAIARSEGVTDEAVEYLADVRSRAYWQMDRTEIENNLSAMSTDDFVKEVWIERLRELPLEYRVWSDVQRTRKFPVTSEANPGVVSFVDVVGHTNVWGHAFQEKHLLFPISENERQRNPNLLQNKGYEDGI
jgi:hypothetical protein